jgi:TolA-binding protein|tara:strand:- start:386 stop:814 length:429 start_codon:yes stop_codon:yes gene_type:complete
MKASYGGHSTPSRAPVLLGIMAVATAGHMAIYDWGDFKVSKMLPAYPSEPRTVDQQKQFHNSHLESQLAKAKQRITELSVQDIPEDRETVEEEKARWQEQKEHLLARIAELEEKILLVIAANGEHTSNDSDFIGRLAEGGIK